MTTSTTEGPKIEDDATVVAPPPQSGPGPGIDVGVGEDTIDDQEKEQDQSKIQVEKQAKEKGEKQVPSALALDASVPTTGETLTPASSKIEGPLINSGVGDGSKVKGVESGEPADVVIGPVPSLSSRVAEPSFPTAVTATAPTNASVTVTMPSPVTTNPSRPGILKADSWKSNTSSFRMHVARVSSAVFGRSSSRLRLNGSSSGDDNAPQRAATNSNSGPSLPAHKLILRYLLPLRKRAATWLFSHLQPHPRSYCVVILDNGTVYKKTRVNELVMLRFLQVHLPSVPVPRVWDAWVIEEGSGRDKLAGGVKGENKEQGTEGEKNFHVEVVMERVPGNPLHQAWRDLNDAQKKNIAMHLKIIMDELRDLDQKTVLLPPEGHNAATVSGPGALDVVPRIHVMGERQTGSSGDFVFSGIGSISGGPCVDTRVTSDGPFGPFNNESDFNDYLVQKLSGKAPPARLKALRERMRDDHPLVLTHGNLVPQNVIVHRGHVSAIVDWDQAGWRPEYWERTKSLYDFWLAEWPDIVKDVMPSYEEEVEIDLELREIDG